MVQLLSLVAQRHPRSVVGAHLTQPLDAHGVYHRPSAATVHTLHARHFRQEDPVEARRHHAAIVRVFLVVAGQQFLVLPPTRDVRLVLLSVRVLITSTPGWRR